MGQSKPVQCVHCHAQLPVRALGEAVLKYCPFCGKELSSTQSGTKTDASGKRYKSMQQVDGGYMLNLGDDPVAATPAKSLSPDKPSKPIPLKTDDPVMPDKQASSSSGSHAAKPTSSDSHHSHSHHSKSHSTSTHKTQGHTSSSHTSTTHKSSSQKSDTHHHSHHHHHHKSEASKEPSKKPSTPVPKPAASSSDNDDSADLLSLDMDLVKADQEMTQQQRSAYATPMVPQKHKHVSEPPKPAKPKSPTIKSQDKDEMALPTEPLVGTPAKPKPESKPTAKSDDTLAGLQDEEDQLNLAEAEGVVELTVDDDDDLDGTTGGLVVTDVVDEDDLDYEIKPEESVPVVGLNMLQQQVGRASSWDRVPLPELAAASDQSSVYELAVEPEATAGKVCPACNAQMPFDAVVCAGCGYNIQLGRYVAGISGDPMGDRYDGSERYASDSEKYEEDQEYYHRQHMMQDVYLPSLVLLAMLVLLVFTVVAVCPYDMVDRNIVEKVIPSKVPVATSTAPLPGSTAPGMGGIVTNFMSKLKGAPPLPPLTTQQKWFCIAYLFGTNLLKIGIKIPFMFIGMLLVVRLFGVSFGGVFSALTKLLAIAMAAHVIAFLVEAILFRLTEGLPLWGMETYVSFPFAVIAFVGLNMKFFELDVQEAIVLYLASYLLPIFASMLILMWVAAMLS